MNKLLLADFDGAGFVISTLTAGTAIKSVLGDMVLCTFPNTGCCIAMEGEAAIIATDL